MHARSYRVLSVFGPAILHGFVHSYAPACVNGAGDQERIGGGARPHVVVELGHPRAKHRFACVRLGEATLLH
jgi:hypothetical protein